ncbi:MAG: hypothetical protein ACW99G_19270 [Candidatus Thorarchaeota archaeon]|jgi:hypothetical protein
MDWNEDTAKNFAEQVGQQIGQQLGEQLNQTVSSAVSEGISQGMQKLFGANASDLGSRVNVGTSRETDIGEGERATIENLNDKDLFLTNQKLTYDNYLEMISDVSRRSRLQYDQMSLTNLSHYNRVLALTEQNLASSYGTADMTGKNAVQGNNTTNTQMVAHRDIATNEQWNLSEQNYLILKSLMATGADGTILAQVLSAMINSEGSDDE